MADALIDRIMDNSRSRLPGAIDTNIYQELQYVLDDFFRMSGCWREKITVPVLANETEYELEPVQSPARVYALLRFEDGNGSPLAASITDGNILKLAKAVDPADYYATVTLTVTSRVNDEKYPRFPQWVSDRFSDVISDGIAGRLMALPAKPFSSPQHALFFQRKFRSGTNIARIEADRQNVQGGQNWLYPFFAAQGR